MPNKAHSKNVRIRISHYDYHFVKNENVGRKYRVIPIGGYRKEPK